MAGDNPWGALRDSAAGGGFVFDEAVAGEAADLCADLMSIFNVVKELSPLTKPVPEFGKPIVGEYPGAVRLQEKLEEAATDFDEEVMPKHRQHVTELGEAFVLAGKLYSDTDRDAAGEFARRVRASSAGNDIRDVFGHYDSIDGFVDDTYTKRPDLGNFGEAGNQYTLPASLSGLAGTPQAYSFSAQVPPGEYLDYPKAYYLGQHLATKSSSMEDRATYWYRMQIQLDTGFITFSEAMRGLVDSDRWRGTGAGGARDAVNSYLGTSAGLTAAMGQMADNLMHMAQWIMGTWVGMPRLMYSDAYGEGGETAISGYEEIAQAHYNAWYKQGVELTDGVIPKFPAPTPPGDTDGNGNGNGNGNGGGGGGGGTGAGAGMPTGAQQPTPNQSTAEQQAQLREIEQARAELEEQAQLQQEALQQQQQQMQQQASSQQMMQAAQQGLQQLGQLGQQLSTAAQQALQQAGITGLPGMPALQEAVKNYQSALQKAGKLPAGLGGGGAPGGSSPAGTKTPPVPNVEKASKLFPRAAVAAGVATGQSTGVVAASQPGMPMGGAPMGGGAGGAQGAQQKDHKRADYLDSTEWLEEGIGDPAIVAKPVVDQ